MATPRDLRLALHPNSDGQMGNLLLTTSLRSLTSKTSSSRAKLLPVSATPKPVKANTSLKASPSTAIRPKRSSKSASVANSLSSPLTSVDPQCEYCGSSDVQLKYVTRSFDKGAALMVVESIPMWSCPSCGESYFSAQTMHEIERIKAQRKSVAVNRSVPVAAFEAATV